MKKWILSALIIATGSMSAQETTIPDKAERLGEASSSSTMNASVLSMMGWGITLAVGVAALAALIDNSTSHAH